MSQYADTASPRATSDLLEHADVPFELSSRIGGIISDGMDMNRPVWVKPRLGFPRRPDAPMPATLPDRVSPDPIVVPKQDKPCSRTY
jgi:hypothetical protein